ncbi:expressed unknown protein [Seminavis robusta]|uniref:Uncharacterized protein n=1 Tax=Seminavis robusta TaxID=568900 RepID=A0A9N8EGS2_9STRA|nr:expressed unknown protein [Seminavis robusta]|eukprot:Sro914_g219530.1 n/a (107) ;mRNA; r:6453-6773
MMMFKDFSLGSSNSDHSTTSTRSDRSTSSKSSSKSKKSSSSSRSSSKKTKGEFVAESMKEMSPHLMIQMLEMYAENDNQVAFEAFQGLKNSSDTSSSSTRKSKRRS